MLRHLTIAFVLIICSAQTCKKDAEMKSEKTAVSAFETIKQGTYLQMTQQIESYVFRTHADVAGLDEENRKAFDTFDWTNHIAIGVAAQTNTGGYTMHIREMVPSGNKVKVRWEVEHPPKGAISTMVISQPFHFVKVKRPKEDVEFEFEQIQ